MSEVALCNEKLVELLNKQLQKYSETYFPLHEKELKAIKKCTALVEEEGDKIIRNIPKKRAHVILKDIWTHIPEVFILCSLATTPSHLGTLKSTDYMEPILTWWRNAAVPGGLGKTLDSHSDILPKVLPDNREVQIPSSLDELLEFVRQKFDGGQLYMALPYSGSPLPFVRMKGMKLELSWEFANAFMQKHKTLTGYEAI